jgi:GTPase involved in cell partitioning and DNA repair
MMKKMFGCFWPWSKKAKEEKVSDNISLSNNFSFQEIEAVSSDEKKILKEDLKQVIQELEAHIEKLEEENFLLNEKLIVAEEKMEILKAQPKLKVTFEEFLTSELKKENISISASRPQFTDLFKGILLKAIEEAEQ